MCGIAGIIGQEDEPLARRMIAALAHRGPDYTGLLVAGGVSLAHARLSVIDTSAEANQPMVSADGTVAVVFNGEIYNFAELRQELEDKGQVFKTNSDTEVLLALYAKEGEQCVRRLSGMFAIALYDFSAKRLMLARDRMGEKPLYWSHEGDVVTFASELNALLVPGLATRNLSLSALTCYLQLDYVPTPRALLDGVHKLEPGTVALFTKGKPVETHAFWEPPRRVSVLSESAALDRLDELLAATVSRELVGDVPLGVFLSGGLDSSAIAYYAQKNSAAPIHTFSIGFDEPDFDESAYARDVAAHIGSVHHERIVRAEDALALVTELPDVLSEPIADASVIPTLLLSRFARESVTVALGGDGGDELFAGYPTFSADTISSPYRALPSWVRKGIRAGVDALPASVGNISTSYALRKLVSSDEPNPVHRHMEWLGTFNKAERFLLAGPRLVEAVRETDVFEDIDRATALFGQPDTGNRLLFAYARSYLMDQVLVKMDRASMHYGLETRAPFLDHALAEFVFSLPYHYKYRNGTTKYLLKKLMEDKLPQGIAHRKKKGFGIPLARWLRGPLRDFCLETLAEDKLRSQGYLNPEYVSKLIDDHMSGARDNRKELWNLMVFQIWRDRWVG